VLFNSIDYVLFLPAAWLLFWAVPRRRLDVLLVASYVFYASWSPPYAALVFGLVVTNYFFGLALGRATRWKGALLGVFVAFDLGVLGFYKYVDFGLSSAAGMAHALFGLTSDPTFLRLALPLGISFFTFEFIHYLVDIYRGSMPVHSFSKFHVFAAFFPTQIAGPIKRFQQFVPALAQIGRFDSALAREGLGLIGRGLAKKVLLADRLAPIANRGFAAAGDGSIATGDAWIATLAFSLQIFFDFSGYTDIARGSAQLFGFKIPINFDAPYLATSLSDFWRRWHISLSSWLRDYLYIPLGGSRRSRLIVSRNLLITMVLGGLWHGAAWHFVGWGALWGVGLVAHHLVRERLSMSGLKGRLAGWGFTQVFVLVAWVLFRADTFAGAAVMLTAMAGGGHAASVESISAALFVVGTGVALLVGSLLERHGWRFRVPLPAGRPRPLAIGVVAAAVVFVASISAPAGRQVFIYFQF
jgi:D-alanyl-lipoteichoic acid acyltransferase DltB (MBOAT superfamily)